MRGFQQTILLGNLTNAPQIGYTVTKKKTALFTVAINKEWKDEDGLKKNKADFIPVIAWERQADVCEQILKKGQKVLVIGRLENRKYQNSEGKDVYALRLIAEKIDVQTPKSRDEADEPQADSNSETEFSSDPLE